MALGKLLFDTFVIEETYIGMWQLHQYKTLNLTLTVLGQRFPYFDYIDTDKQKSQHSR